MSHESHSDRSRREAMMEGAFYQQKRTSPTALAIVVLMHGAALTALAMAKGEVIRDAIARTKIFDVKPDEPPPPPVPPQALPPVQRLVIQDPPVVLPPRADPPAPPAARKVEPARARANL